MLNFRGKERMTALRATRISDARGSAAEPLIETRPADRPVQTRGVQGGVSETKVDQLLVERVQKGDKRAFDLLIQKYQHRIVSLVSRYVSDSSEAQDVAHKSGNCKTRN